MPRVKKYLKYAICIVQGLFFTLCIWRIKQPKNAAGIVLGLKKSTLLYRDFLPKILSEVT